jgi:hypothetical protein
MAKYTEAAPIILAELEKGATQKEAAEKACINIDTFYEWMKSKTEFSDAVRRAKENARLNAVASVERSLLELAQGFEYEEVRTEYESKHNPNSGQYEPVIKKQVRTKKRIVASVEAIKFFLTNKAPEEWKNRIEQTNLGNVQTNVNIRHIGVAGDEIFPSSEDEVDAER